MTSILANILTTIGGILICYQDFKYRWVHISTLLIFCTGVALSSISTWRYYWVNYVLNILFLILFLGILKGYLTISRRRNEKLINRHLGLADIYMFIILCIGYGLQQYVLLIIASCITGLSYWLIRTYTFKKSTIRIPLAGIMAILHIIVLGLSYTLDYNPLNYSF